MSDVVSCQENEILIHAYIDGELDLPSTVNLENHLRDCTACAQQHRELQTLRSGINSGDFYFKASDYLRERVRKTLEQAETSGSHAPVDVQDRGGQRLSRQAQKRMWW